MRKIKNKSCNPEKRIAEERTKMHNFIKKFFKSKMQESAVHANGAQAGSSQVSSTDVSDDAVERRLSKEAENTGHGVQSQDQSVSQIPNQALLKAKKDLRIQLILQRKELNELHRLEYGKDICEKIIESEEFLNAKTIFSFLPTEDEPDLSYLEAMAFSYNKTVAYPVIRAKGVMEAHIPEYYGGFECNRFGIREPILEKSSFLSPDQIDLVIVPMLGFDENGYRIGYGGGYYDRYLPKAVNAYTMGVCYEELKSLKLPVSDNDYKLHSVVTQSNRYRF